MGMDPYSSNFVIRIRIQSIRIHNPHHCLLPSVTLLDFDIFKPRLMEYEVSKYFPTRICEEYMRLLLAHSLAHYFHLLYVQTLHSQPSGGSSGISIPSPAYEKPRYLYLCYLICYRHLIDSSQKSNSILQKCLFFFMIAQHVLSSHLII